MLLVVDAGNSQTELGLFDAEKIIGQWRVVTTNYRTRDELHILLTMLLHSIKVSREDTRGCCIASVVPHLNSALQQACEHTFGIQPLMVEPGVKTGIILQCDNPKEVGADRIANAAGARAQCSDAMIIIDFGTATTFDVMTEKAEWLGGLIVPGIQLSADALFENCARLPRVPIKAPRSVIGRDTVTNIQSGLTYGYADMVDGLVVRITKEMGIPMKVIATGGLSRAISAVASQIDLVDPLLTMKGLCAVYERNLGKIK